jgi:hypothetical protein
MQLTNGEIAEITKRLERENMHYTLIDFARAVMQAASADADHNAPWLTLAHIICTDAGIAQGRIEARLNALRDKLEAASAAPADPLQELADQAQQLNMGYGPNACQTCGKSSAPPAAEPVVWMREGAKDVINNFCFDRPERGPWVPLGPIQLSENSAAHAAGVPEGWRIKFDYKYGDWIIESPSGDSTVVELEDETNRSEVFRQLCQTLTRTPNDQDNHL